uniref:PiggyBac transposable element-derived protein domain-containing protein n=1 Tax=Amphimedon queenslandica TaxID=400682 RepID=A0A1X7SVN5_AMPQE
MPKKPTKWGIKTWTLTDASNGHIWNVKVYTDIFNTSPALFSQLHDHRFEACGTVRINRVGISKEFQKYEVAKGIS